MLDFMDTGGATTRLLEGGSFGSLSLTFLEGGRPPNALVIRRYDSFRLFLKLWPNQLGVQLLQRLINCHWTSTPLFIRDSYVLFYSW
eukprot:UN12988